MLSSKLPYPSRIHCYTSFHTHRPLLAIKMKTKWVNELLKWMVMLWILSSFEHPEYIKLSTDWCDKAKIVGLENDSKKKSHEWCWLQTHGFWGSVVAIEGGMGKGPWRRPKNSNCHCWFDVHDGRHEEEKNPEGPRPCGRNHGSKLSCKSVILQCDVLH